MTMCPNMHTHACMHINMLHRYTQPDMREHTYACTHALPHAHVSSTSTWCPHSVTCVYTRAHSCPPLLHSPLAPRPLPTVPPGPCAAPAPTSSSRGTAPPPEARVKVTPVPRGPAGQPQGGGPLAGAGKGGQWPEARGRVPAHGVPRQGGRLGEPRAGSRKLRGSPEQMGRSWARGGRG